MPNCNEEVFLTIGIPTYNRQESVTQLLDLLATIKPIVACEVLVINNASVIDLSKQLSELSVAGYQVQYIENKKNCGGQENCLRIYENALGRFIWYLGDDDRIYTSSLSRVIDILLEHQPDCLLLNADTVGEEVPNHPSGFLTANQVYAGQFMLGRLICAPLYVLKREKITDGLSLARLHLGCFAPIFLLLLLGRIQSYFYLNEPIVHNKDVPVARNQKLSILPIFMGIGQLTQVPTDNSKRKWVRRLLKREWRVLNNPLHVLGTLAIDGINGGKLAYWPVVLAGWRNYPILLATIFSFALCVLRIFPKSWLAPLILWYANTIKKKNIDISDFRSMDRI